MEQLNVYNILSYGVIGLGFLLAFLAYRLLGKEQQKREPSKQVFTAIYVFMAFSVILCGVGFASEYIRSRADPKLFDKVTSLEGQLEVQGKEHDAASAKRDSTIHDQDLLLQKYRDRAKESGTKSEKVIANLMLIAKLPFISEEYRMSLNQAIKTLALPRVED